MGEQNFLGRGGVFYMGSNDQIIFQEDKFCKCIFRSRMHTKVGYTLENKSKQVYIMEREIVVKSQRSSQVQFPFC